MLTGDATNADPVCGLSPCIIVVTDVVDKAQIARGAEGRGQTDPVPGRQELPSLEQDARLSDTSRHESCARQSAGRQGQRTRQALR